MTRSRSDNGSLKPWLLTLSLGATVGGWALLARQMAAPDVAPPTSTMPLPTAAATSPALVSLPPVPTVAALRSYAAVSAGAAPDLDLPPVSVVVVPTPRPAPVAAAPAQAPKGSSAPSQSQPEPPPPPPPVTDTRSSS